MIILFQDLKINQENILKEFKEFVKNTEINQENNNKEKEEMLKTLKLIKEVTIDNERFNKKIIKRKW